MVTGCSVDREVSHEAIEDPGGPMPNRYYTRKFLNLPGEHAGAYVLAEVTATSRDDSEHDHADCTLLLADCSRQVSFDFPLWSVADRRNSVRKARILADALARFADALEVEADLSAYRLRAPDAELDTEDEPESSTRPRRRERPGRRGHTDRLRGTRR
jgi:hypothetical protein